MAFGPLFAELSYGHSGQSSILQSAEITVHLRFSKSDFAVCHFLIMEGGRVRMFNEHLLC